MTNSDTPLPVAILAGGLATRMRPLTETVPKVLLEVAGRPFFEYQLESLKQQGIRDVVMCVGFLGEMVEERFGDGSQYGMRIRYSWDGPVLLGTGGAIRRALPLLGEAFFILYGDSYLQIDFNSVARAFHQSGKSALMTVFRNNNQWDTSNVHFCDGQILAYDKVLRTPQMECIDYGLSICRASVLESYTPGAVLDLSVVMRDLAMKGDLAGYEADRRFYEIGSFAGLSELDRSLAAQAPRSPQLETV